MTTENEEWARTLGTGNEDDFRRFVDFFYPWIEGQVERTLGLKNANIDDVANAVLVKVWRSEYDPQWAVTTWLHRIIHTECCDHWRREKKWRTLQQLEELSEISDDWIGATVECLDDEKNELLDWLMEQLPPSRRRVMEAWRNNKNNLTDRDLAEEEDMPWKSFRRHKSEGLKQLRKIVRELRRRISNEKDDDT